MSNKCKFSAFSLLLLCILIVLGVHSGKAQDEFTNDQCVKVATCSGPDCDPYYYSVMPKLGIRVCKVVAQTADRQIHTFTQSECVYSSGVAVCAKPFGESFVWVWSMAPEPFILNIDVYGEPPDSSLAIFLPFIRK